MKYPWLFVGARVVCLNADPRAFDETVDGWEPGGAPVEGEVYTVTKVWPESDGHIAVSLAEIQRGPAARRVGNEGYGAERFAPIRTINTDSQIEAMRNLMLDATVRSKVRA